MNNLHAAQAATFMDGWVRIRCGIGGAGHKHG